ncbi:MAG: hypothetical protein R2788_03725 [Saprospiraceae bacterium]
MDNIYARGVIELAAEHQDASENFVLNIVDGESTYKRTLASYLTLNRPCESIDEVLKKKNNFTSQLKQLLFSSIAANIRFDQEKTERLREVMMAGFVTTKGLVNKGNWLCQRGNLITNEVFENWIPFGINMPKTSVLCDRLASFI